MPNPSHRSPAQLPVNNTVKLSVQLRTRIAQAMGVAGYGVWSEFCRVALTEKCQVVERALRTDDEAEFARIYGAA